MSINGPLSGSLPPFSLSLSLSLSLSSLSPGLQAYKVVHRVSIDCPLPGARIADHHRCPGGLYTGAEEQKVIMVTGLRYLIIVTLIAIFNLQTSLMVS